MMYSCEILPKVLLQTTGPVTIEVLAFGIHDFRKVDLHKQFLRNWLAQGNANRYSFDELWSIREACIAGLSQ